MDGSEKSTNGRSKNIDSSVGHPSLAKVAIAVSLTFMGWVKQVPLTPTKYFLILRAFLLEHAGYCQIYDAFRLDII
jgi:hypothetical protein